MSFKEEYERLQRLIHEREDGLWVEPELRGEVESLIEHLYDQLPKEDK